MRYLALLATSLGFVASLFSLSATAQPLPQEQLAADREEYRNAVKAIDRGKWTEYEQLRPGLDNYPLALYLDYEKLTRHLPQVRPADARQFLAASDDSPLENRFLARYLSRAGRDGRWRDFLAVQDSEPNDIELKCYYFRAKLSAGDQLAAWEGAERLWVHGQSRPKACDPLFKAWMGAGKVSDDVVWARLLKAFEAREASLMRYVARKGSDQLTPWSERLQAVYAKPARMRQVRLPGQQRKSAEIASLGLVQLARYNPVQALDHWQLYQKEQSFSAEEVRSVERAVALQGMFARSEALRGWLPGALQRQGDDGLTEIWLRWALLEQDWGTLEEGLGLLTDEGRQLAMWRYWRARLLEQRGQSAEANALLAELATERDYYGFMAADRLGKPYAFNNEPVVLVSGGTEPMKTLPAVMRIGELYYHEEPQLAQSEWYRVLEDRSADEKRTLAQLASTEGWHTMAINAAAKSDSWNALDLRFPTPYKDSFSHYAQVQRVPPTELMAIARRESTFMPEARSPVGARGLMQVMPATGAQVARSIGRPHTRDELYQVEHNILLGSAYYRQLLDRFDGNRIFTLAAYNAGPHRVDRWRGNSAGKLPVDAWVETIPYRETRNYVKTVLEYNVVFQYQLGDTQRLLSDAERSARY